MSLLVLFARQELLLSVRSRWTQLFTVVFAALALAVAGAGYVLSGGAGLQDFARTAVSLIQLVVLLVPMTALVLGVMALAPDRGAAELLYSQPVARHAVLVGKLLGLFVALIGAQAVGFGLAGLVIVQQAGAYGAGTFGLLMTASALLTAIFLGLAAALAAGTTGRRRTRALAVSLILWFALVILYDVAALGAASLLSSGHASRLLVVAALVNPVDAIRTGTLLAIEGPGAFGAASAALLRLTGGPLQAGGLIVASIALWLTVPALVGIRRLARADI
jgi:Cu-processing system permease protein